KPWFITFSLLFSKARVQLEPGARVAVGEAFGVAQRPADEGFGVDAADAGAHAEHGAGEAAADQAVGGGAAHAAAVDAGVELRAGVAQGQGEFLAPGP